jgi:hypothetical protein
MKWLDKIKTIVRPAPSKEDRELESLRADQSTEGLRHATVSLRQSIQEMRATAGASTPFQRPAFAASGATRLPPKE